MMMLPLCLKWTLTRFEECFNITMSLKLTTQVSNLKDARDQWDLASYGIL